MSGSKKRLQAAEHGVVVIDLHQQWPFVERGAGVRDAKAQQVADREVRIDTSPGDYVFVPPYAPHREENPAPDEPAAPVAPVLPVGPVICPP